MRCHHCGDTIGVYEPLIVLGDGFARETSRAAEPGAASAEGARYHRACWERRHEQSADAESSSA